MSRANPQKVEIRGWCDPETRKRVRDYCATHGSPTVDAINWEAVEPLFLEYLPA